MGIIDQATDWYQSWAVQKNLDRVRQAVQQAGFILRACDQFGLQTATGQGLSFQRAALIGWRYLVVEIDTRPLPAQTVRGLRGSRLPRVLGAALNRPVRLKHHQDWVEIAVELGPPTQTDNWFFNWLRSLPLFLRQRATLGPLSQGATTPLNLEA